MALVRCTTAIQQAGLHVAVGDVYDTASPTYLAYTASFAPMSATIVKAANEIVNGSQTLQDDDELKFAVVASGTYVWTSLIWYDSGTTPDIQFAFTWPASPTFARAAHIFTGTTAASDTPAGAIASQTVSGTKPTGAGGNGLGTTHLLFAQISGVLINGSTAGNVVLQWAQNTSDASDTTVYAGSWLRYERTA